MSFSLFSVLIYEKSLLVDSRVGQVLALVSLLKVPKFLDVALVNHLGSTVSFLSLMKQLGVHHCKLILSGIMLTLLLLLSIRRVILSLIYEAG